MPSTACTRDHQLAELVDVAGLGTDDHIVGASHVLGLLHALDPHNLPRDLGGLPTWIWTGMDAVTTRNDLLAMPPTVP